MKRVGNPGVSWPDPVLRDWCLGCVDAQYSCVSLQRVAQMPGTEGTATDNFPLPC